MLQAPVISISTYAASIVKVWLESLADVYIVRPVYIGWPIVAGPPAHKIKVTGSTPVRARPIDFLSLERFDSPAV